MNDYIIFSLLFFVIHLTCYVIAGVIDLQLARKVYSGKNRLYKAVSIAICPLSGQEAGAFKKPN